MSRFKPEGRKYFPNLGSNYMGAGRTVSSCSFRSKPAFSKIKQIYGEHLEGLGKSHAASEQKKRQHLTEEEIQQIREKIIKHNRKQVIKQIIIGTIAGIITILFLIWFIIYSSVWDFFI